MNDLELLRQLGDETRPSGPGEIGAARARLLAQLTQGPAARRRRRLVFGGVSVAAAAAVAVGVLITAPGGATSPGMTISAHLTAKQILDRAATAALSEPAVTPRPGQFVYTKEITEYSSGNITMLVSEYWHSVDGLRNSRITTTVTYADRAPTQMSEIYPGCRNGHYNPGGTVPSNSVDAPAVGTVPSNSVVGPAVDPGQTVPSYPAKTGACTVWPAYFPDMPTTASNMLTYLEQTQGVKPGDPASLFHAVAEGVSEDYLLPAQRAALYQLLATTPGLTVVSSVRDAAGRTGVGIQISVYHMVLIFDPHTFAYVGYQGDSTSGGQPPYNDAVLQVAIVDQAGPLP
jgi:hypothetical protein